MDNMDTHSTRYRSMSYFADSSSKLNRLSALIFICLLGFGSYFCYDNPVALQDHFQDDLNITMLQFVYFYAIYSWPNVVLCIIGGFLIDRVFGIRLGTNIYLFILLIGQLLFASGAFLNIYSVMVAGRFIFGVGAQSLAIAQSKYAAIWFKGKEINMVFGLLITVSYISGKINFAIIEPIYNYMNQFYQGHTTIGLVLLFGAIACLISILCGLILGWMNKPAEKLLHRKNGAKEQIVKFSDFFKFKISFWMVTLICVCYYAAIFPFIATTPFYFMEKWNFTSQQAIIVNSSFYFIGAIASPVFGLIVDIIGRNVNFVLIAISTAISAHCLLAFTMLNPYFGMVILGLSYGLLTSTLWPLIASIIPEYQLGTAYGICHSAQKLGLTVISILSGIKFGYLYLEIFFIACLMIALFCAIVLWIYDKNSKGKLNMSRKERKELLNTFGRI